MAVMGPIQLPTVPTQYVPAAPSILGYGQQQSQPQPQPSSPDIGGLVKVGKNLLSPNTLLSNAGNPSILPSGVAGAVDDFGRSIGIGRIAELPGPSLPGTMGPAPAGVGTEGGLSGNFSAANIGAGIAGGLASNLVFGGGMGTNIGSTIGGIAGSFGGPVGTFVGSFLGGGIGSMFGKKKPSNRLQAGGVNMQTGQFDVEGSKLFSQSGDKFSQQNAQIRDAYSMAAADMTKFLRESGAEQVGNFGNLVIRAGDRSGYDFFFEKPMTQEEVATFRANPSANSTPESTWGIQSFGKDLGAFGNGLSQNILERFKTSPEMAAKAKEIFNNRISQAFPNQAGGGGQGIQLQVPMVAGRKSWEEFITERTKGK